MVFALGGGIGVNGEFESARADESGAPARGLRLDETTILLKAKLAAPAKSAPQKIIPIARKQRLDGFRLASIILRDLMDSIQITGGVSHSCELDRPDLSKGRLHKKGYAMAPT